MIRWRSIAHMLSILQVLFALALAVPALISFYFDDHYYWVFATTMAVPICLAVIFKMCQANELPYLSLRDGFIFVILFWLLMAIIAMLPFKLAIPDLSWIDAFFEAVSGLTTTGAEVLNGLESLPPSLQFYHQYLQFLGGVGVIILAGAFMPVLGGRQQLMACDSPCAQQRLQPKMMDSARVLWLIYCAITLSCIVAYVFVGLPIFDAICMAFSTVSTGGFAIHDQSLAYYDLPGLMWVSMCFMLIGAISFNTHYKVFFERTWRAYTRDLECCAMLKVMVVIISITIITLVYHHSKAWHWQTIQSVCFTVIAMLTTTGLQVDQFANWPSYLPITLVLIGLVGGCIGSTSGGIKMGRALVIKFAAKRSLKSLAHPQAIIYHPEYNEMMVQQIFGFLSIFVMLYLALLVLFMATGYTFELSFAAVSACLSNVGVAIGGVAKGYGHLNTHAKCILIFAMVAGRLELMVLLTCCMPSFWRYQ